MYEINKTKQELEKGWRVASVTGGSHLQRALEMYQEFGD